MKILGLITVTACGMALFLTRKNEYNSSITGKWVFKDTTNVPAGLAEEYISWPRGLAVEFKEDQTYVAVNHCNTYFGRFHYNSPDVTIKKPLVDIKNTGYCNRVDHLTKHLLSGIYEVTTFGELLTLRQFDGRKYFFVSGK